MILGNDERRADRADAQPEEQERLIRLGKGQPEHRQRADQQQPGIGPPWPETVAQWPDDEPHQNRHRHRRNVDIGDLVL